MTLEDLRIRLNQHRLITRKQRIAEDNIRVVFEISPGKMVSIKSTELIEIDGKPIIVMK